MEKLYLNTLIANPAISRDVNSHQAADHVLSHGRRYRVSKGNSIVVTAKQYKHYRDVARCINCGEIGGITR